MSVATTPITNLELYMRLKDLSQTSLARLVGISQPKISQMIRHGICDVSQETLAKIAKQLDFPMESSKLLDHVTVKNERGKLVVTIQ